MARKLADIAFAPTSIRSTQEPILLSHYPCGRFNLEVRMIVVAIGEAAKAFRLEHGSVQEYAFGKRLRQKCIQHCPHRASVVGRRFCNRYPSDRSVILNS